MTSGIDASKESGGSGERSGKGSGKSSGSIAMSCKWIGCLKRDRDRM